MYNVVKEDLRSPGKLVAQLTEKAIHREFVEKTAGYQYN